MNTRPIAPAEVASRAALACPVIFREGSTALASRHTLTPPYSAARGPIPIGAAPSAARMARCRPALAAAMPATIGRLAAVNPAMAGALSRASRSADLIQDHHSDARVMTAAASTTASGTLQGRSEAALIRRATDSPSTIRTKIWNRSARCQVFSGTRRDGVIIARAPMASVSRAAAQKAYRRSALAASEDAHMTPPAPKKTR